METQQITHHPTARNHAPARYRNSRTQEFMDDVPTYAILSHTWGGNEVPLQDLARQPQDSTRDFAKIDGMSELLEIRRKREEKNRQNKNEVSIFWNS
jgi:hypothetical protein